MQGFASQTHSRLFIHKTSSMHIDLISIILHNYSMYSQSQLHTHIGWKSFPILECICSCFSIYSSILYQGQHISMYICTHISFGRLGNALQLNGVQVQHWDGIKGSRCRQVYVWMFFFIKKKTLHRSPMVFYPRFYPLRFFCYLFNTQFHTTKHR